MNYWTKLSIEYANQRSYLDDLFRIYPTIPSGIREIDQNKWEAVKTSFNNQNNIDLIKNLLKLKLFPIKDSYVAYLRKDQSALDRNPETVNRLAGRIYDMGLDKVNDNVVKIAIADGVLYLGNSRAKMPTVTRERNDNIMSALVLNEFLYSI